MLHCCIVSLLCMSSCVYAVGADSLKNLSRQQDDARAGHLATAFQHTPQAVSAQTTYMHVPHQHIHDIKEQAACTAEHLIRDAYYYRRSDVDNRPTYARLRQDIIVGPDPMASDWMQPKLTISGFETSKTQTLSDYDLAKQHLHVIGAMYVFDITRNRWRHETQHENATLGITVDHIGTPARTLERFGLSRYTTLDMTRVIIRYEGYGHTYHEAAAHIKSIATKLGLRPYQSSRFTRDVVLEELEEKGAHASLQNLRLS